MHAPAAALPFASPFALRRQPVPLKHGEVLRLDNGRGVEIVARSGVVWISEERSLRDVVLTPGASHRVGSGGRVVVAAQRPSRVVVEWPSALPAPALEIAPSEGAPGRRIGARTASWLGALVSWWRARRTRSARTPWTQRPNASDLTPEAVRDRLARLVPLIRC